MVIGGFILFMNYKILFKLIVFNLLLGVIWGIGNLFMFYF